MKFSLPKFLSGFLLFAVTLPMSATAQNGSALSKRTAQTNQQAKQHLSVNSSQQAAQMAKGRFGGKVLKVQKQKSGYRVKLIKTDGNIISVVVNARTGHISGGN